MVLKMCSAWQMHYTYYHLKFEKKKRRQHQACCATQRRSTKLEHITIKQLETYKKKIQCGLNSCTTAMLQLCLYYREEVKTNEQKK